VRINSLRRARHHRIPDIADLSSAQLLGVIPGTLEKESEVHGRFRDHLLPGSLEWFADSPEIRVRIKDLIANPSLSLAPERDIIAMTNNQYLRSNDPDGFLRFCHRCQSSWARRWLNREPKQCPKCHSPYWMKEKGKP